MATSISKNNGCILMTITPPLNDLNLVNETTIAELDAIAKHHHAGHSYKSHLPFSTETLSVGLINQLLAHRGVNPKLIEWRKNKHGFGLIIKQKTIKEKHHEHP